VKPGDNFTFTLTFKRYVCIYKHLFPRIICAALSEDILNSARVTPTSEVLQLARYVASVFSTSEFRYIGTCSCSIISSPETRKAALFVLLMIGI
jgi:hypothetical protein